MKKIILAAASVAAIAAFAAPASAQVRSGARIEAMAGWDNVSIGLEDYGVDASIDESGIVFGIGAGYDFAMGENSSFGIDIEASESTAEGDYEDGGDTAGINYGRDLYAGLRFTTAVGENTNIYVKAGYTNLRVSVNGEVDDDEVGGSANANGVRAGVGAQFGLGESAYIGAEYRYSNYEAGLTRHQAVATLGFRF